MVQLITKLFKRKFEGNVCHGLKIFFIFFPIRFADLRSSGTITLLYISSEDSFGYIRIPHAAHDWSRVYNKIFNEGLTIVWLIIYTQLFINVINFTV